MEKLIKYFLICFLCVSFGYWWAFSVYAHRDIECQAKLEMIEEEFELSLRNKRPFILFGSYQIEPLANDTFYLRRK